MVLPSMPASVFAASVAIAVALPAQQARMDGYLGVPTERVPAAFDGGFSLHVAAWPLLGKHPGPQFQTGLFGTWMHAAAAEPKAGAKDATGAKAYSDIEGGLGWWRDTRFPTATPKFIMGGVALDFCAWANGPGAGKGRDWTKPQGKYGVAQLSPWVLWPPDGLNLAQGTCGELFGYGYLPLPLTEPKTTIGGRPVPTGNRCWTLFLDTATFKGPVAFFLPFFFSGPTVDRPELAGSCLDSRPADPNRALQMETQWVPAAIATDATGVRWARIAPTRFPVDGNGESTLVHGIRSYTNGALWDAVQRWFDGGPEATGRIDAAQSIVHTIPGKGWSTWRIAADATPDDRRFAIDWESFATPFAPDAATFGWRWDAHAVTRSATGEPLVTLPQVYRLDGEGKAARWRPWSGAETAVPSSLRDATLGEPGPAHVEPYVTPDDGCWAVPGPVAGPFKAQLGDGSTVTYSWYRFADQPALQNADLDREERERLQQRVERLHRAWRKDREYLPPPARGTLARLDPALLVEPPRGLEVGYVPIATRQGRD